MHPQKSLTRLTRLAGTVAFLIAVMPPLVFFALDYRYERASVHIEAEINARIIGELINKNPELWVFEQQRLEELLGKRPAQGNVFEIRRIYDPTNAVLAEQADPIRPPFIMERTPVYNAGRPAGILEISRSLRPAIINSFSIAIISLLFGIAIFVSVKTIPLRALRLTIAILEEEKERAQVTLRSIGDAVVTTNEKMRVEYLNPIAEKLIGWTTEEAKGRPMNEVFHIIEEATREPAVNPVQECLEKNDIVEMENHTILIRKTDGAEFYIEDSAAPIRRNNGSVLGAVMVFHDVTDRKAVQKSLNHMAHHDMLTGLPNRALFLDRLSKGITEAKRQQKKVAVLFLDLDRFKIINDSLGHDTGDRLLLLAAQRLQHCVRASDTIARMGGDEFTAILEGIQGADDAARISEKIIAAISEPFHIDGESLFITTSIGIAVFPKDGESMDTLLKNADAAMYQAKDHGRNAYKFYTPIVNNRAVEKLRFESLLNTALERGEFFLEYQPKLDLRTNRVIGMEALIRWKSERFGQVMPAHFIPILEESGIIVQVGKWVLRTAIAQAKEWIAAGFPVSVSVNFSCRQFRESNIVDVVKNTLSEFDFPSNLLEIEITESILMNNVATNEEKLRELSATGVKISLDDFGTGYSSLSYLRRFPINVLKIDKSFVFDMGACSSAMQIVKTIIDLGHVLGMNVIAEGIETEEQLRQLKRAGCDGIQGYWLSPPMPALTASNWLKSYSVS